MFRYTCTHVKACICDSAWRRHQMGTFAALLALCEGNPPVTGGFPSQRPLTRSFDDVFDLRPNKRLSKQSIRCAHYDDIVMAYQFCISINTYAHAVVHAQNNFCAHKHGRQVTNWPLVSLLLYLCKGKNKMATILETTFSNAFREWKLRYLN